MTWTQNVETGLRSAPSARTPPTADNFKDRFTRLCSADAGDVRFVYVDVHGTTWQDEDGEGEPDKEDEGWILAEDEDGTRKEIVTDDWVADTLRTVSRRPAAAAAAPALSLCSPIHGPGQHEAAHGENTRTTADIW